jgi:hypothetical protein
MGRTESRSSILRLLVKPVLGVTRPKGPVPVVFGLKPGRRESSPNLIVRM